MFILTKRLSWSFIGNSIFALSLWLILSMISRNYGVELLGWYSYCLAIISPIFSLLSFNLKAYQSTDVELEYDFYFYFRFRVFFVIVSVLFLFFISFFLEVDKGYYLVFMLLVFLKVSEFVSDVCHGEFIRNDLVRNVGFSLLLRGLVSLLCLFFVSYISESYLAFIFLLVVSYVLILVFYDLRKVSLYQSNKLGFDEYKKIFITVFPLGVVVFVNVLCVNIPKYFVEYYEGMEMLGVYTGVSYFIIVGSVFMNSLGQVTVPLIRRSFISGGKPQRFLFIMYSFAGLLSILGVFIAYILGEYFLVLFYGNGFVGYQEYLVFIMIVASLMYFSTVGGIFLTSMKLFKEQGYVSVIFMLFSLVSCYYLVPLFGLWGAAYSLFISYSVKIFCILFVYFYSYSNKVIRV